MTLLGGGDLVATRGRIGPRAAIGSMQQSSTQALPPGSGLPAGPPAPRDTIAWLLSRATFGFTPEDAAEVAARGHDGWVDWQLNASSISDAALEQQLLQWPWLNVTPHEALADPSLDPFELARDYKGVRLVRAVHSRRQLFERVVEFWADHFNVFMGRFTRIYEDQDVWRAYALGSFRDLLGAVTRSSSMLAFLDNDDNIAGAGHENLAREILELHTLGVDGPYTENDVREFARCLTGWNYVSDAANPAFGQFVFEAGNHDTGPKSVLGFSFSGATGVNEVETILDYLANHPATIRFVTRRLAQWLIGDDVPEDAVTAGAVTWHQTSGNMKEVVRTLLSKEVTLPLVVAGTTKFRRPFEWICAVLRSTGVAVPNPAAAHALMQRLGQAPFEWPAPDGYPDERSRWVGLVQPRWAIAAEFTRASTSDWAHTQGSLLSLVAGVPRAGWAQRLNRVLTGHRLSPFDVASIQAHIQSLPAQASDSVVFAEALELAFSCPSFQTL